VFHPDILEGGGGARVSFDNVRGRAALVTVGVKWHSWEVCSFKKPWFSDLHSELYHLH